MTVCVVRRQESYQRDVRLSSNSLYKRAGSYIIGRLEVSYVQQRFDKWDISCRISKQRLSQPSEIAATPGQWASEPWGNSGCENTGYWPVRWGAYQRNDFSEPRLFHLLMHRKSTKFLNLSYLVFFIVNNLWLQTTCPLLQIFYISWLPTSTPHLLITVLSGLLEMLSPKNYHQMKYNS